MTVETLTYKTAERIHQFNFVWTKRKATYSLEHIVKDARTQELLDAEIQHTTQPEQVESDYINDRQSITDSMAFIGAKRDWLSHADGTQGNPA